MTRVVITLDEREQALVLDSPSAYESIANKIRAAQDVTAWEVAERDMHGECDHARGWWPCMALGPPGVVPHCHPDYMPCNVMCPAHPNTVKCRVHPSCQAAGKLLDHLHARD